MPEIMGQYGATPIFTVAINFTGQNVLNQIGGHQTIENIDATIAEVQSSANTLMWTGDKIISMSPITSTSDYDGSATVASVSVTIDDSDGAILAMLGTRNIQKTPAYIYLSTSESVNDIGQAALVFQGEVFSDFSWNDKDQTATFTIVNGFEAQQVGYSPEQGYIPGLRADLIGVPWPFGFGTVLKYPAKQLNYTPICVTTRPWGYHDGTLPNEIGRLEAVKYEYYSLAVYYYIGALEYYYSGDQSTGDELTNLGDQAIAIFLAVATNQLSIQAILTEQTAFEGSQVVISNIPVKLEGNWTLDGNLIYAKYWPVVDNTQYGGSGIGHLQIMNLLPVIGDSLVPYLSPSHRSEFTFVQAGSVATFIGALSQFELDNIASQSSTVPGDLVTASEFSSLAADIALEDPGPQSSYPLLYVVNTPGGKIDAVYATRLAGGASYIMPVPKQYYKVMKLSTNHSGIPTTVPTFQALTLVFKQPLSSIPGLRWTDDVFVSFTSPIGPDWHDIVNFIITLYTPYGIDHASYNAIPGFKLNFCLSEEKDAMTLLKDICWQCNVAIWLSEGLFYFSYLPNQPPTAATITIDDIISGSIQIGISPTENIITKIRATWFQTYQYQTRNYLQIRYNDFRYGLIQQDVDYYVFHDPGSILQSMQFWLYRRGNTWQRFKCSVPISFLFNLGTNLQIYDCVNLDTGGKFGGGGYGAVTSISINTETYVVDLEIELATYAGSTVNSPATYWLSGANGAAGLYILDEQFGLTEKAAQTLAYQRGLAISAAYAAEELGLEIATQFGTSQTGGALNVVQPDPVNGTDLPSSFDIFAQTDVGTGVNLGYTGENPSVPTMDQGISQMSPPPSWDYNYPNYPQLSGPTSITNAPGTVDSPSGNNDGLYNCTIYKGGLTGSGAPIVAQALQEVSKDIPIPKGTWVIFCAIANVQPQSDVNIGVGGNTDTTGQTQAPTQDNADGNTYYFVVGRWLG